MKHLICILALVLPAAICMQAQTKETKKKIESIKGEWQVDNQSGNVYHYMSIKKPNISEGQIFDSIIVYLPKFYENIKMLYKEDTYEIVSIDTSNHTVIINGRSGIVYSLFSTDLYTQDILHTLTISLTKGTIEAKIEHKEFRKKIGLRDPSLEVLELKNLYPINLMSDDQDFYGNSFYNLHKKMMTKLDDFKIYIRRL